MGWIFGAAAGGMAFGSTLGDLMNPIIGWRRESSSQPFLVRPFWHLRFACVI